MQLNFAQGFKQSGIPVTVVAHCYQQTTFSEYDVTDYDYLQAFRTMKKKVSDIRNSADVAALFVAYHENIHDITIPVCGSAYWGKYVVSIEKSILNSQMQFKYGQTL